MSDVADYNTRQVNKGLFTEEHTVKLLEFWQQEHFLVVNGAASPTTLESIWSNGVVDIVPHPLLVKVLGCAKAELGHGEDPKLGNNRGAYVDHYRSLDGTGKGAGGKGSWCGVWICFVFIMAMPEGIPFEPSRGAKRLGKNIAAAGRELYLPEPGAVIVWDRGVIAWKGHIGLCYSYDAATDTLVTIEGNKTRKGQRFAEVQFFTYPNGAWRKRLDRIATIIPQEN